MDSSKLMFRDGFLDGQRILVTGGGTGLGREMAEAFLKLGATVYICGRRGGVIEETATALTGQWGGRVVPIVCDIRDDAAIQRMVAEIWADGGALTGLVNNAAGNFISRTRDLSPRGFDAIANIVFRGTFLTTLEIGKRWLAEGVRGNIVSILTTWVWNGSAFAVPSAMSKAGLNAMTQSLAVEWGPSGIRLNGIAPGPFPTKGAWDRLSPDQSPDNDDKRFPSIPLGRVGEMVELCNLATFLVGPGADYVTGQTIAIDGGAFLATGGNFSGLAKLSDEDWTRLRGEIKSRNEQDKSKRTI